jgi:hypothetical protein
VKRLVIGWLVVSACARVPSMTALEKRRAKAEATAAYDRKDYATCAKDFHRIGDWYSTACCSALAGHRDEAFGQLARAAEKGEFGAEQPRGDDDLTSLRDDPRWPAVLKAFDVGAAKVRANDNAELRALFDDDQGDRKGPNLDWAVVGPRDEAREQRVNEILAAGGAKTSADYFHAAMVYQHGSTPAQAQRAHELALEAVALDSSNDTAKWLAAASEDRRLMYEKKPQKYGTQFTTSGAGWVLWEVDPTITDEERAQWNVPTLAEAKEKAVKLNQPQR